MGSEEGGGAVYGVGEGDTPFLTQMGSDNAGLSCIGFGTRPSLMHEPHKTTVAPPTELGGGTLSLKFVADFSVKKVTN